MHSPPHSTPHKAIQKGLVSLSGSSKGWLLPGDKEAGGCQPSGSWQCLYKRSSLFFSYINCLFLEVIWIWEIDCTENDCSVMCSFAQFSDQKKKKKNKLNLNIWDTCVRESVIYFKAGGRAQWVVTHRQGSKQLVFCRIWFVACCRFSVRP